MARRRRPLYIQRKRDQLAQGVKRIRQALRAGDCEKAFWTMRKLEHELLFNHARIGGVLRTGLHTQVKRAVAACRGPWRPWAAR